MDNELAWMLSVMPDAPRALDRLVAARLSRDVKQRPANGRAVCEALAAVK